MSIVVIISPADNNEIFFFRKKAVTTSRDQIKNDSLQEKMQASGRDATKSTKFVDPVLLAADVSISRDENTDPKAFYIEFSRYFLFEFR